jgi:S-adenosylmethionine-diacylglycerol 3-amino-3-carboxypropyl transferase
LPPSQTVFCIGSGGCTAFSLLVARPARLLIADINPAQVHLLALKKAAFAQLDEAPARACLLHDARPFYAQLRPHLNADAQEFWDQRSSLLRRGLNQSGVGEQSLRRAMRLFRGFVHARATIHAALNQSDLSEQQHFYRMRWTNWRWNWALRVGLSKTILRLIYGNAFLRALPDDFAALIRGNLERVFTAFPTCENGYLWQTFLSEYPPHECALPSYLQAENHFAIKSGLRQTEIHCAEAAMFLRQQPPRSLGFFACSNILEVSSRDHAAQLIEAIAHAASRGALVCFRWIFPPPQDIIVLLDAAFSHQQELSESLSQLDRSLFCKFIRIYRV